MLTFTVFENHKKSHFSIIVTTLALPISYLRSRGRHPVSSSSVSQVRSAWPGCYIFHMWQLFVLLMCLEAVRERKTVGTGSQACLPQYFSAINWRWKPTVVVSFLWENCPNFVVLRVPNNRTRIFLYQFSSGQIKMSHSIHILSIQIDTASLAFVGSTTSNCPSLRAKWNGFPLCTFIRYFRVV